MYYGWSNIDPEKIRSIKKWPIPSNVREVRGLTGYYQRFVQHYGSIAAPLTQLLKLGSFKWTEEAHEAFLKLQDITMTLPVLALPDFNIPFEVETDSIWVWSGSDVDAKQETKCFL